MSALPPHPLVEEACLMGFDPDHAVAALLSFADTKGGDASRLSTAQHGDAFIDYLFSFQHKQQQQPQEQHIHDSAAAVAGDLHPQRRKHARSGGIKRPQPRPASDSSAGNSSLEDSDFTAGEEQLSDGYIPSGHREQQQQPRKRLRRSTEAATQAGQAAAGAAARAAAAGAEDIGGPAAIIARHRHRVLRASTSSSIDDDQLYQEHAAEGEIAGTGAAAAAQKAKASGKRSGGVPDSGGPRSWQNTADLDFMITQSVPAPAAAAGAGSATQSSFKAMQSQPSKFKQQQQQKKTQKRASAGSASQSKLDQFFRTTSSNRKATPSQQQQQQHQEGPGRQAVLSPLQFTRVTHGGSGSIGLSSLLQPTAAGAAFKTPAASLRGPMSHAAPASGGFGAFRVASRPSGVAADGMQQQQLQRQGAGAAAAAGGPVPPWWRPLTAEEAQMDKYDLVNLKVFGHGSFRSAQKAVVQQAVQGRDLFVLMPTGGGKSLCYQLPAVMVPGVTVVVCPLLSLMQDQVRSLCLGLNGGVPASFLSSQQSSAEAQAVKSELSKALPTVKLLYVTPEQLVKSSSLRRILQRLQQRGLLARFVIDEAHCVSMWGHDFRPDYKGLRVLRGEFPGTPITAVTATATTAVQQDITNILGISRSVTVHQTSFLRPNLLLKVVPKVREVDEDSGMPLFMVKLIEYIKNQQARAAAGAAAAGAPVIKQEAQPPSGPQHKQQQQQGGDNAGGKAVCSGIIYCLSRKEAEGLADALREQGGIKAAHYHAGMTAKQRTEVQNAFFSGAVQVIVATIAFGMGIDKPDVRFVVHFCLSKSLEGYYQEAGRAGRDGAPAECVLLYSPADISRHMHILRMSLGGSNSTQRFSAAVDKLETMRNYALNPGKMCRHAQLLDYFGVLSADLPSKRCGVSCDVCRNEVVPLNPEEWKIREETQDEDPICEFEEALDLLAEDEGLQHEQHNGVDSEESSQDEGGSSASGSGGSDCGGNSGSAGSWSGSDDGSDDNEAESSEERRGGEDSLGDSDGADEPSIRQAGQKHQQQSFRQKKPTVQQQQPLPPLQPQQKPAVRQQQQQQQPGMGPPPSCGFQTASQFHKQQQQQTGGVHQEQPAAVQHASGAAGKQMPNKFARGRLLPSSLLQPKQQQSSQAAAPPPPNGFASAARLLKAGASCSSGVVTKAADTAGGPAAVAAGDKLAGHAKAAGVSVDTAKAATSSSGWVVKQRLKAGGSGGGSRGSTKVPPAEAIARELQEADDEMF